MNAFHFFEAERHQELDVGGCVGVVCQLLMIVKAVFLIAHAQGLVPRQAHLLPVVEPLHLVARTHEELHFHLLKLTHTEDELTGHNLVAERLAYLRDAKWQAHAACLLHVEEVNEYSLCRLGTQIHVHSAVGTGTHLRLEHQVKLAHVGPVLSARYGVNNIVVENDLLQFL